MAYVDTCPPPPDLAGHVIVVDKSDFTLALFKDKVVVPGPDGVPACFAVALGASPVGDKARQGDERTPVGTFRITHKNPTSMFHLSLGLDYPQARYAEAAYAEKRIDAATRDKVVAADKANSRPPMNTALGGDIFLHGGGPSPRDWTDGCVAIENTEMDWLYATVSSGTTVIIRE